MARQSFYDRARAAYAIVMTGELRPYGNLILKKRYANLEQILLRAGDGAFSIPGHFNENRGILFRVCDRRATRGVRP